MSIEVIYLDFLNDLPQEFFDFYKFNMTKLSSIVIGIPFTIIVGQFLKLVNLPRKRKTFKSKKIFVKILVFSVRSSILMKT